MNLPGYISVFDQRNRRELAALKAENVLMRLRIPLNKPPASAPEVVLSVFNGHAMDAGEIMSAIAARGESMSPRRLSDTICGLVRSRRIVNNRKGKWKGEYVRVVAGLILALVLTTPALAVVESSTNLTEWAASPAPWDQVLEMARTNRASPGKPHYYYRLSPPAEPSPARFFPIPKGLAWNNATNFAGAEFRWASDPTNLVQVGENSWAIQNPAMVFLASPISTNIAESSTSLTEWTSVRLSPEAERSSDGFHAARQTIPPYPPTPIKERVTIGDPFFPIPSRKLTWDYAGSDNATFEIWWGDTPENLVQVGETANRVWPINVPARLGWFGVRARTLNGYASKWATVPNLK